MKDTELPWVFTEPLEREGIPYMIVGGYAAIAFGVFRTTNDLDTVIAVGATDAHKLQRAFPDTEYYCPPHETLVEELSRPAKAHFNIIHHHSQGKMDCYPAGRDMLHLWGLKNRKLIELHGRRVAFAPPELVILKKLEYFREGGSPKHINDIRGIFAVNDVDRSFMEEHVARLGLAAQWAECRLPERS